MMFYTRKNSQYNVSTIEICPGYNSKINSNCEEQIILLMIPNKEKESFFCSKKQPALLRGIISKQQGDF